MIRHYVLPNVVFFQFSDISPADYALVLGFPEGGYTGLMWGEFGDFIGTFSTNLSPCGGEMLGVRFVISLGKFRTAGEYLRTKKVEIFT